MEKLQSNVAPQTPIPRKPYDAHPAAADFVDELVAIAKNLRHVLESRYS